MKKNMLFLCMLLQIYSSCESLDQLAIKYETDKRSGDHNYTKVYEHYFSSIKEKNITLLEIGFGMGNSGHMWDDYFPNAELYFIDVNPNAFKQNKIPFSSRAHFHLLDQGDKEQLIEFKQAIGKKFDLIIDDGSHHCHHQILTFEQLFPLVKEGGYYVIEDLHTSYWRMYGGAGNIGAPKASLNSAINFFMNLVHDVNYIGSLTGYADSNRSKDLLKTMTEYQRSIESIHFHTSMCFIKKRISH